MLSTSQKLVIIGSWESGALISCSNSSGYSKGYDPKIEVPPVKRARSKLESKLDAVFTKLAAEFKKSLWSSEMAAFTTLLDFVGGPFDVSA